ncbi:hypothetical protein ILYODFUR_018883 [Ilyodon furcidens]|uniref:Uncharacterized protein n=1 Tax=Ilyodon furcidens TaxID=33524 RepID=A0ABV0UWJ1_9TELE
MTYQNTFYYLISDLSADPIDIHPNMLHQCTQTYISLNLQVSVPQCVSMTFSKHITICRCAEGSWNPQPNLHPVFFCHTQTDRQTNADVRSCNDNFSIWEMSECM